MRSPLFLHSDKGFRRSHLRNSRGNWILLLFVKPCRHWPGWNNSSPLGIPQISLLPCWWGSHSLLQLPTLLFPLTHDRSLFWNHGLACRPRRVVVFVLGPGRGPFESSMPIRRWRQLLMILAVRSLNRGPRHGHTCEVFLEYAHGWLFDYDALNVTDCFHLFLNWTNWQQTPNTPPHPRPTSKSIPILGSCDLAALWMVLSSVHLFVYLSVCHTFGLIWILFWR